MKRQILGATGLALVLALVGCTAEPSPHQSSAGSGTSARPMDTASFGGAVAALEAKYAARVGVQVMDTGTGRLLGHRADERFGFASSVKVLLAAALIRTTTAQERAERLTWTEVDLEAAGYTPVTAEHLVDGLKLEELAEAAVRTSDNLATNLMMGYIGGPAGLTAELRAMGDATTDIRDGEPGLNTTKEGSTANTTTPGAFAAALYAVVAGDYLAPADRATLLDWMSGNATGDSLIRAAAPDGWETADKSGGAGGKRNDVALVSPQKGSPLIVAIFTEKTDPDAAYQDALVSEVASAVFAALGD